MKRMYFKPCKFSCKTDDIKGRLRRLGYRNWWENLIDVENKNARTKLKRETQKEVNTEILEYINSKGEINERKSNYSIMW